MPFAILGSPRSGGGLVAASLRCRGVTIAGTAGADEDAFSALNETLLARHGGGWDRPPHLPEGWERSPGLAPLHAAAVALSDAAGADRGCPWGWHDPATTLTWPFWRDAITGLRALVVVRHPLEVMLSLHARSGCSVATALDVVGAYQRAILETVEPSLRVVTHYRAHARDAVGEADRVLAALGCQARGAAPGFRAGLGHVRLSRRSLAEFALPDEVTTDYARLCAEAGFPATDVGDGAEDGDPRGTAWLRRGLAAAGSAVGGGRAGRDGEPWADVRRELERLRGELATRDEELGDRLEEIRLGQGGGVSPERARYRAAIRGCRDLVRGHVPAGAVVAVISKGDDDLLRLGAATGWHFPRTAAGAYAGWYPAGDLAAIAHLEALRAEGAEFLLVPETYAWWLTSYPGFERHLDRRHRLVARRPGAGVLYALLARPAAAESNAPAIPLAERLGRPPQLLDLGAGRRAADLVAGATVFAPPGPYPPLPYVDASIDIVAVAAPAMLDEARRVARLAVVDCSGEPRWEWVGDVPAARLPSVSIVVPVCGNWPLSRGCLEGIWATIPEGCDVEVIVVDDGSADETPTALATLAAAEPRLVVLRHAAPVGFVGSCNAAAIVARGALLVFLNNDTVPLPGWLAALAGSFATLPHAGVVGGTLLFPDGRLQEAGGIVFADGSACHFGRGEADARAPLFRQCREVDYVSGALLATPRALFERCGGFDPGFAPGYYEDTDYCFRVRQTGAKVYFQPDAVVVHREGATAGTDPAQGMKRFQEINRGRFVARHAAALASHPPRPASITAASWARLFHRGPGRGER